MSCFNLKFVLFLISYIEILLQDVSPGSALPHNTVIVDVICLFSQQEQNLRVDSAQDSVAAPRGSAGLATIHVAHSGAH